MAAGKHRRSSFSCLTLARIFVASVVALGFAATVVVVVFTACFGPNNVRLSVTHGHIQSAQPLWSVTNFSIRHLWRPRIDNITIYTPADELAVWVSMDAHDPTGHANNVCVNAVDVLDMPHAPSLDGMVRIATVNNTVATGRADSACAPWHPRHNGSSSMQLDRWITVKDPLMLCYISQKYGGVNYFTAMLKVDMTIYPKDAPENHTTDTHHYHYCWPVTIGNTRSIHSEAVTCKPSDAIDYSSIASVLNACDHLTQQQRLICNRWRNLSISCESVTNKTSKLS